MMNFYNIDSLNKMIKSFFSSPDILDYYSRSQIFPAERKLFQKYLKKNYKILDLFCGSGRVAIPLAKQGYKVVGVDNNPEMIKRARILAKRQKIKNVKFICCDASQIKFKEKSFDCVIVMDNSLEHVPGKDKRIKIFSKIYNVLKNDGLLITSFHSILFPTILPKVVCWNIWIGINKILNPKYVMELNDAIIFVKYVNQKLFYQFYSLREIKYLVKKSGFSSFEKISRYELCKKIFPRWIKINDFLRSFLYCYYIFKK